MPLLNPMYRFVLVTNAKCGGTTMKTWFVASLQLERTLRGPLAVIRNYGLRFAIRRYRCRTGIYDHPPSVLLKDPRTLRLFIQDYRERFCRLHIAGARRERWFTFAVVRNPYDRLVSGFVDKFCCEDLTMPFVQEVVSDVSAIERTDGTITFRQFVDYLARVDERKCNPHWRRQTYVLDQFDVGAYVRLEHLAEDMQAVEQRLGLAAITTLLATKRQANEYRQDASAHARRYADVNNRDLIQLKIQAAAFPDKHTFYTPEIRQKVAAIFRRDFERLPYDVTEGPLP